MIDCNNHHPTFRVHVRRRLAQTSALLAAMSVSACHRHVIADVIPSFVSTPLCVHRGVDTFYGESASTLGILDTGISSIVNEGNPSNKCDGDPDAPSLVASINESFSKHKLAWQVDCTQPGYLTQVPAQSAINVSADFYYTFQITNGGKINDYVVYFRQGNSFFKDGNILFYGNAP